MNPISPSLIGIVIAIVIALILIALFLRYFPILLWVSTRASGVRISLLQLFLMRIRNVPPHVIAKAMVEAHKAGLDLTRDELEAHYLAGGHVEQVCMPLFLPIRPILTSPLRWRRRLTLQVEMYLMQCRCR